MARALLLYRYHTLDGARQNARDGDSGVRATRGSPLARARRVHQVDGGLRRQDLEGEEEIHVTAAVAYGLMAYVAATGDQALMTDYGAEILFETSRLGRRPGGDAGRTRCAQPGGRAREFHEHVDNSAYTNNMVRWHLQQAAHVYAGLAVTHLGELASLSELIGLEPG